MRWTLATIRQFPSILQTQSLVPADRSLVGHECEFRVNDSIISLPGDHFSSAREMYCRDVYRFLDSSFRPRPATTVVDLGANVGLFSLYAALSGATVLAVEAQSEFAYTFHELMARNGVADKVRFIHGMVGSGTGVVADPRRRAAATHWGSEPHRYNFMKLLDEHGFTDPVDLLKIDVEGSEYDLFSDSSWLSRMRRVVMEAHEDFGVPEELALVLEEANFEVQRVDSELLPVERLTTTGLLYAVRSSDD